MPLCSGLQPQTFRSRTPFVGRGSISFALVSPFLPIQARGDTTKSIPIVCLRTETSARSLFSCVDSCVGAFFSRSHPTEPSAVVYCLYHSQTRPTRLSGFFSEVSTTQADNSIISSSNAKGMFQRADDCHCQREQAELLSIFWWPTIIHMMPLGTRASENNLFYFTYLPSF